MQESVRSARSAGRNRITVFDWGGCGAGCATPAERLMAGPQSNAARAKDRVRNRSPTLESVPLVRSSVDRHPDTRHLRDNFYPQATMLTGLLVVGILVGL